MTAFIMVAGMFTDSHVWEEVAARLESAGAAAHPVALSGLGGPDAAGPGAAGADLETHIADVLAVVDSVAAVGERDIVLVGHDYGIHPVVGAADRRAGRVARIVHVDTGLPRDGVPALAAVGGPALRERVTQPAEAAGPAARVRTAGRTGDGGADPGTREGTGTLPPPATTGEWQQYGSTAGVPEAALRRLTDRALPQPLATLLRPLRLTGAAAALPTAAVLCTAGGASTELVQTQVDLGDPVLGALAVPRVAFFDLPTGHWPMLSEPAGLADVLIRAAAGEGRRLEPAGRARRSAHPFPLEAPEVPRERTGNVDLYVPPADGPLPAVVFVHGGPVPSAARPTPRDWPTFTGYARHTASRGVAAVTLDHRLHGLADYPRAAEDVAAAVELVRADPRIDADRVALWFFSGGGPLTADWLQAPPPWLRCVAATYPILAPLPGWGLSGSRFHPARAVWHAGALPLVLTRVGRETPEIAATVEEFLAAAGACGADVEVVDVPDGHHGFETRDPAEVSRDAVRRAIDAVLARLAA